MIIKCKTPYLNEWWEDEIVVPDSAKIYSTGNTHIICSKDWWATGIKCNNVYAEILFDSVIENESLPISECPITGYIIEDNKLLLNDIDYEYFMSQDFDEHPHSFIFDKVATSISKIIGFSNDGVSVITVHLKDHKTGEPIYSINIHTISFDDLDSSDVVEAEEMFIQKFNLVIDRFHESI